MSDDLYTCGSEDERKAAMRIAREEFEYWSAIPCDTPDNTLANIVGSGAAANILAGIALGRGLRKKADTGKPCNAIIALDP